MADQPIKPKIDLPKYDEKSYKVDIDKAIRLLLKKFKEEDVQPELQIGYKKNEQ